MQFLWDTNVLSEFMRGRNPHLSQRATGYLTQYGRFSFSLITRYEILRGLQAKRANRQLAQFEIFCQGHEILALSDEIIVVAADLWAHLARVGQLIEDNDILIAATALHHGLPLATGNLAHFSRVPGLILEDWTKP